jgi:small conductance mechanosensitive channel
MITTPSVVRVDNLGDSAVELRVMGDVKPGQQWALMGELRKRIKNRFDQENIEIPWPHTMVYFGNTPQSQDSNH